MYLKTVISISRNKKIYRDKKKILRKFAEMKKKFEENLPRNISRWNSEYNIYYLMHKIIIYYYLIK